MPSILSDQPIGQGEWESEISFLCLTERTGQDVCFGNSDSYRCCCCFPARFSNQILMPTGLSSGPDAQCCQNGAALSIHLMIGQPEQSNPNPKTISALLPTKFNSQPSSSSLRTSWIRPQFQHCPVEPLVSNRHRHWHISICKIEVKVKKIFDPLALL